MNIVLDTNVLVSGLLTPFGPCGEILRMISSAELTLAYDARIISEYREVLIRPKFRFDKNRVDALLDHIEYRGIAVASPSLRLPLPDLDDQPFLEVAFEAKASCIITGNHIHFPTELCLGVTVYSPSEFLIFYKGIN